MSCPECGGQMAYNALSCPKCGYIRDKFNENFNFVASISSSDLTIIVSLFLKVLVLYFKCTL